MVSPDGLNPDDREVRIGDVVEDVVRRREAGEALPDDAVIAAHTDLMPELAEDLEALAWIRGAHGRATDRGGPLSGGKTRHASDTDEPTVPCVEGYEILRPLQAGGQGVVYRAVQKSTKRQVAIKVPLTMQCATRTARRRFDREIDLVAQLKHPNIVTVFDSGVSTEGVRYYVMDYIDGVPLNEYVRRNQLDLRDTLRLFATVCHAVQYANQRGVIHRDLKPPNILVDAEGNPKVVDFGLARTATGATDTLHSVTGQVIGTLPYISPEQARGRSEEIDIRTDVYSLGVILYELLTGQYPYPVEGSLTDVLRQISEASPTPPGRAWRSGYGIRQTGAEGRRFRRLPCPIDGDVHTILLKALSKERERRYQSAGLLAQDIEHYLRSEPIEARRDSALYVLRKTVGRHKTVASLSLLLVLALAGLATVMTVESARVSRERDRAVAAEKVSARERDTALAEKLRADLNLESFRRALNSSRLSAAYHAYERGATDFEALLQCPADLRAWDWYRLWWLSDRSSRTARMDSPICDVAAATDRRLLIAMSDGCIGCWDLVAWTWVWGPIREAALLGHIVLFPDKRTFLLSCGDNVIRRHEVATGRLIRKINRSVGLHLLAISADGQRVVGLEYRDPFETPLLKVRDLESGREVASVTGPASGAVMDLSPDGRMVVFNCPDTELSLRDTTCGREILRLKPYGVWTTAASFSSDGKRLVSAHTNGRGTIWDARTGAALRTLEGHVGLLRDVTMRPNGRIATVGQDATLRLWDADTGRLLRTLRGQERGLQRVRFVPDSSWIVSSSGGTLNLWDEMAEEDTLVWTNPSGLGSWASFSPDGERIAAPAFDGAVLIFEARHVGVPLMTLKGHEGKVQVAESSPDGRTLLSAGDDGSLRIWDAQTGRERMKLTGHAQGIPDARFLPDGRRILTGSWDHTCKVWDSDSGACLWTATQADEVWQVAVSPDGRRIASGGKGGQVYLWDATTGRLIHELTGHTAEIDALAFSPDGKRLVSGGWDSTLRLWDVETGRFLWVMSSRVASHIYDVTFTRDGRRIVSGSGACVEFWHVDTGDNEFAFGAHEGPVYTVAFSGDGTRLLTAGGDGTVKVWPSAAPPVTGHASTVVLGKNDREGEPKSVHTP